jgi:hypothetical protein
MRIEKVSFKGFREVLKANRRLKEHRIKTLAYWNYKTILRKTMLQCACLAFLLSIKKGQCGYINIYQYVLPMSVRRSSKNV